jgi:hypothetical protein
MSGKQPVEIRASDAEREQTGELLREATVEGRLTLDEYSERFTLAQRARTRGELEAIAHDLPRMSSMARQRPTSKISAVLSGVERTGSWQLAPTTEISSIVGGCKLDLRYATISSGITTLDARIFCGNLELIVPEGVEVEIEATMILSSRTIRLTSSPVHSMLKPVICITGTVFCGSITVRDTPKLGERLREVMTNLLDPPRHPNRR